MKIETQGDEIVLRLSADEFKALYDVIFIGDLSYIRDERGRIMDSQLKNIEKDINNTIDDFYFRHIGAKH